MRGYTEPVKDKDGKAKKDENGAPILSGGELVFFFDEDGRAAGLELYREWVKTQEKLTAGKEFVRWTCDFCKLVLAEFICQECKPNHTFCAACDYGRGCRMVKHVKVADLVEKK
jgi:hypothetical protein